jgi:serine phosphatase RsbU (regulator of sigma subunit)
MYRIFVADARGHGVQAALRTLLLKSEYDRLRATATTPAFVLEQLNARIFHRYPRLDLQCTAACVDIHVDGRGGARVVYASAAAPPFIHITPSETHELIASGPYLGVVEDISLANAEVQLARGDRFVMYTDGLYEQVAADGRMYGVDQLLQDMTLEVPIKDVPARVAAAVESFAGSLKLVDDVTLVVVEAR